MANVKKIRANGYRGELIARMTVTERTDIVDAVRYLAENPDYSFTSIHWQMDANFSRDLSHRRFAEWVDKRYNPGIRALVKAWVDDMEQNGKVRRWYPFVDPMEDLLYGRASLLRCGAGHANYAIMTDGHIAPCPVMIGMKQVPILATSRMRTRRTCPGSRLGASVRRAASVHSAEAGACTQASCSPGTRPAGSSCAVPWKTCATPSWTNFPASGP